MRDGRVCLFIHLPTRELLHLGAPWPNIVAQIPERVDCLVVRNVEAVPDHENSDLTTIHRFAVEEEAFLSYVNGKSAGRVGRARQCGPHRFTGEEHALPLELGAVLHFESCPYSRWRDKFAHYAAAQRRLSGIPFPFYIDSIRCLREHGASESRLRSFWRRRKAWSCDDYPGTVRVIEHGALVEPSRRLRARACR